MEKIMENKLMIVTIIFFVSLFYVGGLMTKDIDISHSINDTQSINM